MKQLSIEEALKIATTAFMVAYCEAFFEEWERQVNTLVLEIDTVQDWQKAIER